MAAEDYEEAIMIYGRITGGSLSWQSGYIFQSFLPIFINTIYIIYFNKYKFKILFKKNSFYGIKC